MRGIVCRRKFILSEIVLRGYRNLLKKIIRFIGRFRVKYRLLDGYKMVILGKVR